MENFAGRDSELDFLERQYDRTGSQLIVVYGNKGVGKTRLLQEFCGDREWKYYLARACSEKEQRYQWSCEQGEAFPFLEEPLSYGMLLKNACRDACSGNICIRMDGKQLCREDRQAFQKICGERKNREN